MPRSSHDASRELPIHDSARSLSVRSLADTIIVIKHQLLMQLAAYFFRFDRVLSGLSILHILLHRLGLVGRDSLSGHFVFVYFLQEAHA